MRSRRLLATTLWITVAAIMAQAILAGSGLFGSPDLFELHGWIGSGVVVLAAAAALLAFIGRQGAVVTFGSVILAAASVSQIGMGYAGRRGGNLELSALHVPLGVAMLGLAVALAVLATARPKATGDATTPGAPTGASNPTTST